MLSRLNKEVDKHNPRITILGIGNLLLKDEGVGIHIIQELDSKIDDMNVNVVDGGTSPDITSLVDGRVDKLIIIDAVKADDRPGTVYRFVPDDLAAGSVSPISLHEIGVLDSLKIMTLLDSQPKSTVIIGIEPKTIDYGIGLSPEVDEKLPEVINLVLKEIEESKTAMEVDR